MEELHVTICSDLHLEFYHNLEDCVFLQKILTVDPRSDTLIIAGDFGYPYGKKNEINKIYQSVLTKFKERFKHIIYVAGNHEYYQTINMDLSIDYTDLWIKNICDQLGIHFLQKDSWIHPLGVEFVGCTLWTQISHEAYDRMNDSVYAVKSRYEYMGLHNDHLGWLEQKLENTTNPTIVVTHHLPSYKGISPKFKDYENSGFATNLDHLFKNPVIGWISGHTHEPASVEINGIQLHINPIGYRGEKMIGKYSEKPFVFKYPTPTLIPTSITENDATYNHDYSI